MNIIIPLCGIGKRFQEVGYTEPKPLIDVFNKKMICHVLDNLDLEQNDNIFIVYHTSLDVHNFSTIIKNTYPNIYLIPISTRTNGAAETVLFGIDHILLNTLSSSQKCLLIDCDTIYNTNIIKKIDKINTSGVIYFEDNGIKPIYSYIILDNNNKITDIKEKEKISNNANTGAYFFKDINELQKGCKYVLENNMRFKDEYYISCVIKHMISEGHEFTGIKINKEHYISLGTPEELQVYKETHYNLLFDLDGTLVKTDNIYYKVWQEILAKFNITLTYEIFNQFIQGNNDRYAMERLQIDKNSYKLNEISDIKDSLFSKYVNDIIVIDGVRPFMKSLKKVGHSICIVSNCNRKTCELIVRHIGIEKYIDYIVIGNECMRPKPYSDPYFKAISLLCTTSDKCIIFEDSKPGILSAFGVSPKNIVGVNNGSNKHILDELNITTQIENFTDINLETIIKISKDMTEEITKMLHNSLCTKYNIKSIEIDTNKLKGGYISDVIQVKIHLKTDDVIDCVLKYENDYTSSLTKMAYTLGLFDREYYFYENIRDFININVPKYIGTIRDSNFISKGILLENINKKEYKLNLDLNKENIDVSLKVIEQCAKFHALFWNKDLTKSFKNLKKHNDIMFNPVWGDFIRERWPLFVNKWKHLIKPSVLPKLESIVRNFDNVQQNLSMGHLTLCHGDVKSGNIFYKKEGKGYTPYFIDWQYIAHGKGVQDIVFFIIESFNIYKIKEYVKFFKTYYYIKLKEYNITEYSSEEYNRDFSDAVCYFPFFVAIWFGTTPTDELIDASFPFMFIQKLLFFIEQFIII